MGLFPYSKVSKVRLEHKKALVLWGLLCYHPSHQVSHLPKQELPTWPARTRSHKQPTRWQKGKQMQVPDSGKMKTGTANSWGTKIQPTGLLGKKALPSSGWWTSGLEEAAECGAGWEHPCNQQHRDRGTSWWRRGAGLKSTGCLCTLFSREIFCGTISSVSNNLLHIKPACIHNCLTLLIQTILRG